MHLALISRRLTPFPSICSLMDEKAGGVNVFFILLFLLFKVVHPQLSYPQVGHAGLNLLVSFFPFQGS